MVLVQLAQQSVGADLPDESQVARASENFEQSQTLAEEEVEGASEGGNQTQDYSGGESWEQQSLETENQVEFFLGAENWAAES